MPEIKQHLFCPGPAIQITKGKFEGLAVMEPYSEEPVILTTRKLHGVVLVCMIGIGVKLANLTNSKLC